MELSWFDYHARSCCTCEQILPGSLTTAFESCHWEPRDWNGNRCITTRLGPCAEFRICCKMKLVLWRFLSCINMLISCRVLLFALWLAWHFPAFIRPGKRYRHRARIHLCVLDFNLKAFKLFHGLGARFPLTFWHLWTTVIITVILSAARTWIKSLWGNVHLGVTRVCFVSVMVSLRVWKHVKMWRESQAIPRLVLAQNCVGQTMARESLRICSEIVAQHNDTALWWFDHARRHW